WVSLTEHLSASRKRLKELGMAVVPSAAQVEPRVQSELAQVEEQLSRREAAIAVILNKLESDTAEAESLKQQIDTIGDDLRKYKDVRKIRKLGSEDEPEVARGHCPTCHQELADSLLDTSKRAVPMSVDQNVSFYEEQIELFSAVHANAQNAIQTSE